NGFTITYPRDVTEEIGDGFFFSLSYPGMTGGELVSELISYGVSSINLDTTGSLEHGVRACTSRMRDELYPVLEERMQMFHRDHPMF
ncbi:MAG: pyridoxal phosphate-dependent aminotransferase, partial [Bacteroidaceae bacterium]|nr:pyridoxal phosphate-dependent aminotransferase [Bacteroidaceae bacterium]